VSAAPGSRLTRFLAKRDYSGSDMEMVRRVTAAAAFLSAAVIAVLSPLSPPDQALAGAGWAVLVVVVGGYTLLALRLERVHDLKPDVALAAHYAGLAGVAVSVWLSGGRESPYLTLFLIWLALAGASHPPRRTFVFVATGSTLAALPLAYDWADVFAGDTALRLIIWAALALMACAWTTQVRQQRVELMEDEEHAQREARIDPLTGLGNRRAFDERLERAIEIARRDGQPLSVVVSDLDGFKEINDSYGHLNGDAVLQGAADAMRAAVRDVDACYRWGGDEFAVVLPGVDRAAAERIAGRISASIVASCTRPDGDAQTLAWGTAELTPHLEASDLLAAADLELMARKHRRERGSRGSRSSSPRSSPPPR
jgi:diguanylate cyclase (GGDEF)-like protein